MVVGLIVLGICILIAVALICFKGITVTYHKDFTVNDNREKSAHLTDEQVKLLEKDLNTPQKAEPKSIVEPLEVSAGPMDAVIQEIQDLFGPEQEE